MKSFVKEFCKRGLMCGAWGGPLVLAVVLLISKQTAAAIELTAEETIMGIVTTEMLGFIAAGITAIYQMETLPKIVAALIQFAVLYLDYLAVYLLNGWMLTENILPFTAVFVAVFLVIWLFVYFLTKHSVNKINQKMVS